MPTHEAQAELANDYAKTGLLGKTSARVEVADETDQDYEPQYALGDVFNPAWNTAADVGANEVQTLQITNGWAGSTYTITYDGQTTAALGFDATAAEVEAALNALSNVTPGDIRVTKAGTTADHTYTLNYGGQLARLNVDEITTTDTGLAPAVTVDTTVEGDADPATNEIQTVEVDAAGGTFTLTYSGQTTAAIAYDASAAAVDTALEALSNIEAGDLTVTKSGNTYTVTFGGTLAATDVAEMTADGTGLTVPGTTIATTTPGADA